MIANISTCCHSGVKLKPAAIRPRQPFQNRAPAPSSGSQPHLRKAADQLRTTPRHCRNHLGRKSAKQGNSYRTPTELLRNSTGVTLEIHQRDTRGTPEIYRRYTRYRPGQPRSNARVSRVQIALSWLGPHPALQPPSNLAPTRIRARSNRSANPQPCPFRAPPRQAVPSSCVWLSRRRHGA